MGERNKPMASDKSLIDVVNNKEHVSIAFNVTQGDTVKRDDGILYMVIYKDTTPFTFPISNYDSELLMVQDFFRKLNSLKPKYVVIHMLAVFIDCLRDLASRVNVAVFDLMDPDNVFSKNYYTLEYNRIVNINDTLVTTRPSAYQYDVTSPAKFRFVDLLTLYVPTKANKDNKFLLHDMVESVFGNAVPIINENSPGSPGMLQVDVNTNTDAGLVNAIFIKLVENERRQYEVYMYITPVPHGVPKIAYIASNFAKNHMDINVTLSSVQRQRNDCSDSKLGQLIVANHIAKLKTSDFVIIDVSPAYGNVDHLVILGLALGLHKKIYITGAVERFKEHTVFSSCADVRFMGNVNGCLAAILRDKEVLDDCK